MDLDEFMQASNAKARRGRLRARQMIGSVIFFALFLGMFLFVAAPNTMGGGAPGPSLATLIGMVGLGVGLLWMVRIARANPEPDAKSWRYRC